MKKLFLVLTSLFISCAAFCQSVNGVPISDFKKQYIGMECVSYGSTKYRVNIDYGQEKKFGNSRQKEIQTAKCKTLYVNSPIAALNLLYENGYEFLLQYEDGYILQRRRRFDPK